MKQEKNKTTILVIETNHKLFKRIQDNLEEQDFKVERAMNAEEALAQVKIFPPVLIIVEAQLPGISGVQLATIFRIKPYSKNIPILMLTDDGSHLDSIKGVEMGIDDYIIKPFTDNDLDMAIKTIFKKNKTSLESKIIEYNDIKLDTYSFRVLKDNKEVRLGPTEFKILQCLIENPKKPLSRQYIIKYVWGYNSNIGERTIDVHINRLRAIFKNKYNDIPMIRTIRAAGYCLDSPSV